MVNHDLWWFHTWLKYAECMVNGLLNGVSFCIAVPQTRRMISKGKSPAKISDELGWHGVPHSNKNPHESISFHGSFAHEKPGYRNPIVVRDGIPWLQSPCFCTKLLVTKSYFSTCFFWLHGWPLHLCLVTGYTVTICNIHPSIHQL